jgi:hypothetical protein
MVPTEVNDEDSTLLASVAPVSVPAAAVTVIAAVPSKFTPFIARGVASAVAAAANVDAEAVPVKLAVIVPAEKLLLPSRATIALAVLALVAVVAELDTLSAVLIVAK